MQMRSTKKGEWTGYKQKPVYEAREQEKHTHELQLLSRRCRIENKIA